jgi:hypothetical protein
LRFDGLLAERESKSVPGVLISVEALESAEYTALECQFYTRTVVCHGKDPIKLRSSG